MIITSRTILILFLSFTIVHAQKEDESILSNSNQKNNLQLEFLGKGFYYSVGYERKFEISEKVNFGANIGLCLFPGMTSLEPSSEILVPFELNTSIKKLQNEFIIGAGTTFWKYQVNYIPITNNNLNQQPLTPELISETEWFAHISFEYRLHAKSKPLFYKVGYIPLFFDFTPNSKFTNSLNYQTSFTIGIGWSF